jgi:hypothetical protein
MGHLPVDGAATRLGAAALALLLGQARAGSALPSCLLP